MKSKWIIITISLVLIGAIVFASFFVLLRLNSIPIVDRETVFQAAVWDNFAGGNFSGFMPFSELAKHGDFGIGTLDGLDGEMIALNGEFYHIATDGKPKQIEPSAKTPYADVTYFEADKTQTVAGLNYTKLQSYLDNSLPSKTAIYAIKVTGTFDYVLARSPPKQYPPYPLLPQALINQTVWTFSNVSATAVGFWFPNSLKGVDYVGYHLHIISDDRTTGGHLIDCIISNATVQIDQINRYNLILP